MFLHVAEIKHILATCYLYISYWTCIVIFTLLNEKKHLWIIQLHSFLTGTYRCVILSGRSGGTSVMVAPQQTTVTLLSSWHDLQPSRTLSHPFIQVPGRLQSIPSRSVHLPTPTPTSPASSRGADRAPASRLRYRRVHMSTGTPWSLCDWGGAWDVIQDGINLQWGSVLEVGVMVLVSQLWDVVLLVVSTVFRCITISVIVQKVSGMSRMHVIRYSCEQ